MWLSDNRAARHCKTESLPVRDKWTGASETLPRGALMSSNSGGMLMESSHLNALQQKHAGLERQIATEMSRPAPDQSMIQALKKRKLRLKEELFAT